MKQSQDIADGSLVVRFGDYEYLLDKKVLLNSSGKVRMGSRALSLLHALALKAGQVVSNDELIAAAWPSTFVDPTNLRVQMASLRRLLEGGVDGPWITNSSGRGYSLNGERPLPAAGATDNRYRHPPAGLAAPLTPLLGRREVVSNVADRIRRGRLVTLVGPGGIGKTRVAIEVCWRLSEEAFADICFVDLAPLTSAEFLASAISATLEVNDAPGRTSLDKILHVLRDRKILLVLDNCEHVLDELAAMSEILLRALPHLRLLTTSREPLNIAGEVSVRLGGLDAPEDNGLPASLEEAMQFPAVELLVERALAGNSDLSFSDDDVAALIDICRRLDCIPLAIELAAPRLEIYSPLELLQNLELQLSTLGEGRRSASPRHRTLRATLEWSYASLSGDEQRLLTRLAVFRSTFTVASTNAISLLSEGVTMTLLASLVSKSLIVVDRGERIVRYRLLETTRSYMEEKLQSEPEADAVRRHHAEFVLSVFKAEKQAGQLQEHSDRIGDYRRLIDDVRSAITWALGKSGDAKLGIRLAVDSAPIWLRLSILTEYASVLEAAADMLWKENVILSSEARWLAPSLHNAHYNAVGLSEKILPMLVRALQSAEETGDHGCALLCLWALFGTRLTQGRYLEALLFAQRFAALAPEVNDAMQLAMSHRIVALSLWRNGDFVESMELSRAALVRTELNRQSLINLTLIYKQGVAARGNFSNLLWLQGFAEQAADLAQEAIEVGLKDDVVGLSYSLAQTIIPLSFWIGDLDRARREIDLLLELARDSGLGYWLFWGRCYDSVEKRMRSGVPLIPDFLELNLGSLDGLHRHILATILPDPNADWFADPDGERRDGQPHWCSAELKRVGALKIAKAGEDVAAMAMLETAITTAAEQGAFAWELRAATSLAEMLHRRGEAARAKTVLAPVVERIIEGAGTADVLRALALLKQL
ncbi:winged helix-turn-helix domain-containing protein [Neorhizobium galegae]|uniref:winged helix-turn-helix domain-containing protein n=1 Tax=Neorhizobium galegae TaxID=399 RepID=UPI002101BFFF|nr:winged helix-turn-helix domain-containing protein [Neorhizobium galegae]MCQ1574645.1 winged helix-turn-helix domain-containing protein [Neorhizobium galegae]